MTLSFSSSLKALSIAALILLPASVEAALAAAGGLPDTYRAARPLPAEAAGNLRARTVESFGMISVSSVYSKSY